MRKLVGFTAGAIAILVLIGLGGAIFLKAGSNGFSARSDPSSAIKLLYLALQNVAQKWHTVQGWRAPAVHHPLARSH